MKKLIIIVISCFYLSSNAQQASTVKQLSGKTISTSVLTRRLASIVDSARIAGLQVAIINNHKTVWKGNFGYRNIEKQLRIEDNTVMYAASLTKPVSAYLFLRLAEKGIFNLDIPVQHYLKKPIGQYPKWKDLGEDTTAFNKITPRMLLSHSSGMPVLRGVYQGKVNLIARPGEKFYYSNEGLNLLGFMIEEYTGKLLEQLAKEEVFIPLHMDHTSMIWDSAFEENFSLAYYKEGKVYGSERRTESRAAGSMTTTASDYAKFVINLMSEKGLSHQLYAQMLSPQIYVKSKRGFGPLKDSLTSDNDRIHLAWGLGTGLFQSKVGKVFFHTGHGEANQNYFVAFPEKGIAVVLLSNSENFEHAIGLILNACIGDQYSPLRWLGHLDN
ncbi:serine hydrolase [Pedobacter sp. HMWF019]|uniref:serine hydrolase domain-containing protein n=1 Tax=Pedobacter sp. HMWF019 TaxID=2056856 RepID=UPI001304E628|nr:serine hydrolase domain-containing protein [Pedobacter sp. HMWF019]